MTLFLTALLPCPLLLAAAALAMRCPRTIARTGAVLMWLQCIMAFQACGPSLIPASIPVEDAGFQMDRVAALFIILTTVVAAASLTHAVLFFDAEQDSAHPPAPRQIRQFYVFAPLFLVAMYAVVSADNLGYLWIGIEAATLLSAPLVYYHRTRTALEATWKYLIICSVGIAFAFFGTALLFSASQNIATLPHGSLSLNTLTLMGHELAPGSVRLAFVFLLLGYGTKAGLFPLHNWLPDTYSEAPAPASALLSGTLLNCALVALWRIWGLMEAAGQGRLARTTLLTMAVVTVLAAALFLLRQRDLKRMLAYSSMENVGLMAAAVALGSGPGFALLAINHSLVKVALFLLTGNLLQQFGTNKIREIRGLLSAHLPQGVLLLLLIVAITGTPPFGSFLAEWQILMAAADSGRFVSLIALLAGLALAFIASCSQAGRMLFGVPRKRPEAPMGRAATVLRGAVPALLLAISLVLGMALPPSLFAIVKELPR
jgi:hydrogenase-4 component F